MAFFRRFTGIQELATILQIEGTVVEEIIPTILRVLTGKIVCNVGEWLKGDYNTPTRLSSTSDVLAFGTYKQVAEGEDPIIPDNGNGFLATVGAGKQFSRLAIVRVDMRLGKDSQTDVGTVDIGLGNSGGDDVTVTIPGGTRIADNAAIGSAAEVVAVDDDYTVTVPGLGSATVTVNVFKVKSTGASILAATDLFVIDTAFADDAGLTIGSPVPAHTKLTYLTTNTIYSRYGTAIDSTLGTVAPQAEIGLVWSARAEDAPDTTIRQLLLTNALTQSAGGRGRLALTRPAVGTSKTTAAGSTDQGVGAIRDERLIYCYPHVTAFVTEAASERTIGADSAAASLISKLSDFEAINQDTSFLTWITGFEPGIGAENFTMQDYITFKAAGMAVLRFDVDLGHWIVQSDATTNLTLTRIKRRRSADFIEDSLALIDAQFVGKLMTLDRRRIRAGLHQEFYLNLLAKENPPAQKIAAFSIDERSGNSAERLAKGVHTLVEHVQLLAPMDDLDIQIEVGEEVQVTEQ